MFKKTLLASAVVAATVISTGAVAEETEGFIDGSSMDIGMMYYWRERDGEDYSAESGKDEDGNLRANAFGMNVNFTSGYYNGWLGLDASVFSNTKVGHTEGQTEVLYWDGENGQEESSSRLGRARVKVKFGDEQLGFNAKAGITDINAGTIGTSAGINAHAYQGAEANLNAGNFQLSYGYADRFMPDWDDQMDQFEVGSDTIENIQSVGGRYNLGDSGFVELAYGEGADFRKNYHVVGSYGFDLSEDTQLTLLSYYQEGQYEELGEKAFEVNGNASKEYTWSSSATVSHGAVTAMIGYGQTEAQDSKEYNLRLTNWGNSDHRNFLQTWAQLDDFLWDGQKVVKAGVSYNFADSGLPGLNIGASYNYGWDIYNNRDTATENRDGKMSAVDLAFSYSFQHEKLKGLWVGVFPAYLNVQDTDVKNDRTDVKVMATYSISVF